MFGSSKQEDMLELQNFQCRHRPNMHLLTHPVWPGKDVYYISLQMGLNFNSNLDDLDH